MIDQYPPCSHPYDGWFVDDVSLEKAGFLLSEFVETTPPRRGDDLVVARRPGTRYRQKYYGARVQTLVVWALKRDEFGNLPGDVANVDKLKRLFGGGLRQVELTRRISLPFNRVSTRKATVELVDALEGSRTSLTQTGTYVQFAIDLRFADPFWFESENVLENQGLDDYGTFVLWNPGTVTHQNAVVRIYGPAVDPSLACEPTGTTVTYNGTIDYGDFVELDSDNLTAVDSSGTSVAGNIQRSDVFFVQLAPGRNELTLSDGTCDISWRPAYL